MLRWCITSSATSPSGSPSVDISQSSTAAIWSSPVDQDVVEPVVAVHDWPARPTGPGSTACRAAITSMIRPPISDALTSGSYVALSQFVGVDQRTADEFTAIMHSVGMVWKSRTPDQVKAFVAGWEAVEPGMVNVVDWRPDATQPPLDPVDPALRADIGASAERKLAKEFGGVLRKP